MKAMVCEMCQSNDLIKQDGMYVCQYCGTKYTVEEARKLFIEGVVKIDHSDEISKLYEVARRARDDNNSENAQKYYDMILVKDPSSWEANFYTVYFQSMRCKIAEIRSAAIRLSNCEDTVINLIKNNISDSTQQREIIKEIVAKLIPISVMLFNAAKNHYDGINFQIQYKFGQQYINNGCAARDILYNFGNYLIKFFDDTYGDIAAACWKVAIQQHNTLMPMFSEKNLNKDIILAYADKVKKYIPDYQTPEIDTGGCYIATCIYGSYDCPQVWTLRRFRDNTLAETWYGRAFIHTYYAISPTLVKWFGKTKWFKKLWEPILTRMTKKLNENGVENTPYADRKW